MSTRKQKKNHQQKRRSRPLGDITVNDFANSAEPKKFREKKANIQIMLHKVKEDERAWDESDSEEEEKDTTDVITQPRKRGLRKKEIDTTCNEEGVDYPLDIWFLISEYIMPEDAGRFACLCQATLYITTTARFWLTMYRRWYRMVPELPPHLTPWNIDSVHGLRAAVVRSLFFTYLPFTARISAEKPLTADPTILLRTQCVLQWHSKEGNLHKYFFKFVQPGQRIARGRGRWCRRGGRWEEDTSVTYNEEEGCYILMASSPAVCGTTMVMGERLYHAGLGISANLRNHRLRLSFVPAHLLPTLPNAPARKYQVPATEITLEPVLDVRLYPWWHPQYMKTVPSCECSNSQSLWNSEEVL
ncbi:hypothetical protein Pmani_021852 [Petrolisthes manimaculis]|uniref:Transmembrane protein 183 n=1 Tax=Petrolisthes manimaculis TaxID=1843537 RepID=A0AAE1PEY4_9EUCA|nr:hypothetical protein Pmani_021852 [Petrolisthes manimaculis]